MSVGFGRWIKPWLRTGAGERSAVRHGMISQVTRGPAAAQPREVAQVLRRVRDRIDREYA